MTQSREPFRAAALAAALLSLVACAPATDSSHAIHLTELFSEGLVEPVPAPIRVPSRSEWLFGSADVGWSTVQGIFDARIDAGLLKGRTTSPMPVIELRSNAPYGLDDQLFSIEIRARVSRGTTLSVASLSDRFPSSSEVLAEHAPASWRISTPLVPGEEMRTYTMHLAQTFGLGDPVERSGIDRILLAPSNEPDAEFAIESARLVFRKEHLSTVASGVGWHGLAEIYHESIVTRSPERVRFSLQLPQRPWLDLAVGTIEERPVGFRVEIAEPGAQSGVTVLHRRVTRPERWEPARIDLGRWAGRSIDLLLVTEAKDEGTVGLWGTMVVRNSLPPSDAAPPQGVIVFLGDTLRRDHLPMYGYRRDTAPNLTSLAAEGALFLEASAQATWTKVSVPSILSSTYPDTNGIIDFPDRLPAAAVTLAEAFREAGYATFATSSVAFTGQLTNLQQGVEQLHERGSYTEPEGLSSAKTARVFNDRMLSWIEAHRDVPFFAFLHSMDPHSPYEPYPPYNTLWADPQRGEQWLADQERVRGHIENPAMRRFGMPTRDELLKVGLDPAAYVAHEKDWYDGSIRGLDAEVGRVIARLEELGLAERTLFAFVSDHGEEFLDHGRHWHGRNIYGENTDVPLILWGPGRVPAGVSIAAPVQLIDLMPTLLELSGLPTPAMAQGQSLVPLMCAAVEGGSAEQLGWQARPAISVRRSRVGSDDGLEGYALLAGVWKLVRNLDPPEGRAIHELYDHRRDPLDQTDVAGAHPDIVARLAAQLDSWLEWARAHKLPTDDETAASLDSAELERLRSLGYIQ